MSGCYECGFEFDYQRITACLGLDPAAWWGQVEAVNAGCGARRARHTAQAPAQVSGLGTYHHVRGDKMNEYEDIRATLPLSIKFTMDSAKDYWQRRMGLRSTEVHEMILWIEEQARRAKRTAARLAKLKARVRKLEAERERVRNIVDAQDSPENTPTLVAHEIDGLTQMIDGLRNEAKNPEGGS